MGGSGMKGGGEKPSYTPKHTGLLEDVLTGGALGMMMKQNPQSAGFLSPFAGQGMFGQGGSGGPQMKQMGQMPMQDQKWKFGQ
jgi:hypothetical protein